MPPLLRYASRWSPLEQLQQLSDGARRSSAAGAGWCAAAKVAYAVVVSLPDDLDAVGTALRQVRAEEVELPRLDSSAADGPG